MHKVTCHMERNVVKYNKLNELNNTTRDIILLQKRRVIMGEQKTHGLTTKEKMAYACGDFGGVLTFSLISSFLTMFYTDCLHIPLAQITILMFVARIWDAINDPLWGGFIDSRKPTKWGRFRPYVMWASIPLAVAAVLMFVKIPGGT